MKEGIFMPWVPCADERTLMKLFLKNKKGDFFIPEDKTKYFLPHLGFLKGNLLQ